MNTDVVPLATGELIPITDLPDTDPDTLAEALGVLYERQTRTRTWVKAVEDELRGRMRGRNRQTFRRWQIERKVTSSSVWDADALDHTLRELIDDGTLEARDCLGIIHREASTSAANALLGRLTGRAHQMVEACRSWSRKPSNKLLVTPVPASEGANELDPQEVFSDEYRSASR